MSAWWRLGLLISFLLNRFCYLMGGVLASVPTGPNIILILADDLGYGDIGAYGNKINQTPHLDRLAREGLRFTDFHSNGPMCTPTRAALLTGLYQHRFGSEFESPLSGRTQYDHGLPLEALTIAEVLHRAGYATAMYGKWHLGYRPPFLPSFQGFDDFRGLAAGDGDHHSHIDRWGRKDWWHNERIQMEIGYTADLITKHAIDFISQNKNRSFFLYLPHLAIHFPWQGPEDEGYRVKGNDYSDLSKLGRLESKDVSGKVKKMVESIDRSVGQIVSALENQNLTGKTLLFFTSDNGGYLEYTGGYHNISNNGPLRGQKGDVYEGGHRVPAIAWWPGKIEPGICHQTLMTFDLFPTFAELAGIVHPEKEYALDGISLKQLLLEQTSIETRSLFWRIRDQIAVRYKNWKLVQPGKQSPQLYRLDSDLGEANNLANQRPEIVKMLLEKLTDWESLIGRRKKRGDSR